VEAGHKVVTTYTKLQPKDYAGIRGERVTKLYNKCEQVFSCKFGTSKFLELIRSESQWDMICHHAADVSDYKSSKFDFVNALKQNTFNLPSVFDTLLKKNCRTVILTGSVFENDEGKGDDDLRAFSPYGLSKGLTFNVFKYYAQIFNLKLGKFVIPNPFGPFEEPRFTSYLMKNWLDKKIASVNTPDYVRDNIHVSLLSRVYTFFIEKVKNTDKYFLQINPSEYVESQGEFANRFAVEMRKRLDLPCELEIKKQEDFSEPLTRINLEKVSDLFSDWTERLAWDELAGYYKRIYSEKEN
jgi:nucleoside-diphosphate-sugar epimerase